MAEDEMLELSDEEQKLENEKTYDSALASMVARMQEYIVPLINELFGKQYPEGTKVRIRNVKQILPQADGSLRRRDMDAFIELYEEINEMFLKLYHFECETWYDNTVIIRIVEYSSAIAIENAVLTEKGVTLTFPNAGIIFLRPNENIPEYFTITHRGPNGAEMSYEVPTIQIRDYSIDELFQQKLLILLPFYLFRYVKELESKKDVDDLRLKINRDLIDINTRLESLKEQKIITAYQIRNMQELLQRVSDKLTLKVASIREEVDKIMSGYLIRTKADEIYEQGIEKGIEQGIEQGIEKGIEQGIEKGREEGKKEGREEGKKEGREEGEDRLGKLITKLVEMGRMQDVFRAAQDSEYRKQLYAEMNIPGNTVKHTAPVMAENSVSYDTI